MKVTSFNPQEILIVSTDEEVENEYVRFTTGNWWVFVGFSLEEVQCVSDIEELEHAFTMAHAEGLAEKISSTLGVDVEFEIVNGTEE